MGNALGGSIEARNCRARVVVDCLVCEEFARRPVARAEVCDNLINLVNRTVKMRDGRARVVVERVVREEFTRRAATVM